MSAPWETLLDWWFGTSSDAAEVVAQRNGLWFGRTSARTPMPAAVSATW